MKKHFILVHVGMIGSGATAKRPKCDIRKIDSRISMYVYIIINSSIYLKEKLIEVDVK